MDPSYYHDATMIFVGVVIGGIFASLLYWGYLLEQRKKQNWLKMTDAVDRDDESPIPRMSYNDWLRSTLRLVSILRAAGVVFALASGFMILNVPIAFRGGADGSGIAFLAVGTLVFALASFLGAVAQCKTAVRGKPTASDRT